MKKSSRILITLALVFVLVSLLSLAAFAWFSVAQGESIYYELASYTDATADYISVSSGSLPYGVIATGDGNNVYIIGAPQEEGTFNFTITWRIDDGINHGMDQYDGTIEVINYEPSPATPSPSPTPTAAAPVITKHPIGETVEEGDSCSFTAYADDATSNLWMFESPSGGYYDSSEVMSLFPSLSVSGSKNETLTLSGIPSDMDGWGIYCVFYNDAGKSFTSNAYLTVRTKATIAPTTEETPEADEPEPTEAPNEETKETPEPVSAQNGSNQWNGDNDYHWKLDDSGNKVNLGNHSVSEWIKSNDGDQVGICSVCGMSVHKANEGLSTGLIVLIVAVCILLLAVLAYCILTLIRKNSAPVHPKKPVKEVPYEKPDDPTYSPRHDGINDSEDQINFYREKIEEHDRKIRKK